jgi:protein involved in polysaccharide export with SLBB domain
MKYRNAMLAMALVILAAGCSSKPINIPPISESDLAALNATANFPHEGYRLEPGDAIQIRYTHHPELSQDDTIRPDGKIKAKILGEITAAGMTPKELETAIEKGVADQVKDPDVVISVTRFSEKLVYVGGEVVRPGTLPYRKGLTPLQAVTASGGFRDTARVDSVILVRNGGSETNFIARKLNLGQVTSDGVKEPIALAPHDVIFVPRTDIADVNIWVKQHIVDTIPLFRGFGMGYGF